MNIHDRNVLPRTHPATDSPSEPYILSEKIERDPIISVSNLTKTYQLYSRPIDRLKGALGLWGSKASTFYALDDVNFKVARGDQIGILGQNGAGKSTLLQILSGVLTPSSGNVAVRGTVAALLELGAGLNPELTGRENAEFLLKLHNYGTEVITEKVEEIRAFADVGPFFDQPMKLYSSGMFVRVAFATNTLADPDILIVDEALSVGDVRFQKKCIDRMSRLKQRGITVILVTHDVYTAKSFCERLLLLHHGKLLCDGEPAAVVSQYFALLFPKHQTVHSSAPSTENSQPALTDNAKDNSAFGIGRASTPSAFTMTLSGSDLRQSWGVGGARVSALRVHQLQPPNLLPQAARLKIDLELEFDTLQIEKVCRAHDVIPKLFVGVRVDSRKGIVLFDLAASMDGPDGLNIDPLSETKAIVSIDCAMPILMGGDYFLTPGIAVGSADHLVPLWSCDNAAMITIESNETVHGLMKPDFTVRRIG